MYIEARNGREVAVTAKRAQFVRHNRQVLRFDGVWDNRERLYGQLNRFVVHYFLEDDVSEGIGGGASCSHSGSPSTPPRPAPPPTSPTPQTVEIREVHQHNDGREPFPLLLTRQKLPRNYEEHVGRAHGTRLEELETPPAGYYITHADLRLGRTIPVYGRDVLLVDCDPFTCDWMEEQGASDLERTPIEVREDAHELPRMDPAPYKGGLVTFGNEEDSLASTRGLVPRKATRDVRKLLALDGKVLRFLARLQTTVPQDKDRRFVISYYLGDDTSAWGVGGGRGGCGCTHPTPPPSPPPPPPTPSPSPPPPPPPPVSVFEPPRRNSGIVGGMFVKRQRLRRPDGTYYDWTDFTEGAIVPLLNYRFVLAEADQYTRGAGGGGKGRGCWGGCWAGRQAGGHAWRRSQPLLHTPLTATADRRRHRSRLPRREGDGHREQPQNAAASSAGARTLLALRA